MHIKKTEIAISNLNLPTEIQSKIESAGFGDILELGFCEIGKLSFLTDDEYGIVEKSIDDFMSRTKEENTELFNQIIGACKSRLVMPILYINVHGIL